MDGENIGFKPCEQIDDLGGPKTSKTLVGSFNHSQSSQTSQVKVLEDFDMESSVEGEDQVGSFFGDFG